MNSQYDLPQKSPTLKKIEIAGSFTLAACLTYAVVQWGLAAGAKDDALEEIMRIAQAPSTISITTEDGRKFTCEATIPYRDSFALKCTPPTPR